MIEIQKIEIIDTPKNWEMLSAKFRVILEYVNTLRIPSPTNFIITEKLEIIDK